MATSVATIEYILDQLSSVPEVHERKMFGEYALYCGKKVVALVCDDTLFVKITDEGKKFAGRHYKEGFAYPGAKASMEIDADLLEDREWIAELITITEEALPEPKAKKPKSTKPKKR
jgi:TfoX/Sxy family transcriptional regulator of competence genes